MSHRISSMSVSIEYKNYRVVETLKSEWKNNKHSTGHNKGKEVEKYAIRHRNCSMRASFDYEKYRPVETAKSEWQNNKHSTCQNLGKEVPK